MSKNAASLVEKPTVDPLRPLIHLIVDVRRRWLFERRLWSKFGRSPHDKTTSVELARVDQIALTAIFLIVSLTIASSSKCTAQDSRSSREIASNLSNLKHPDLEVRAEAAKRISQRAGVGPEYASGVSDLIDLLHSEIDEPRLRALGALSQIASVGTGLNVRVIELVPAVDPLEELIDSSADQELRRWALIAITDIATNLGSDTVKRVVPVLTKAASEPSYDVSRWAMEGLGEFGPASELAIPVIIKQLEREDRRDTAVETLGKIKRNPTLCVPALLAELDRPELKHRTPRQLRFPIEKDVARSFSPFGPDAEDAVPALIKFKQLKKLTVYATPLAGNRHIFDLRQTNAVSRLGMALPECEVVYAD